MLNFEIKHRFSGSVLFTAEIECGPETPFRVQLGLAVKAAVRNGAYLRGADLRGVDLRGVDLRGADLQGVDLRGTYLQGVDLRGVDLRGVDLRGADLQGVDLRGTYLQGVDLRGVDLRGADLQGAYLQGAYLRGDHKATKVLASASRLYDGYAFHLWQMEQGEPRVTAGCRFFTIAEYRTHIAHKYPDSEKAAETLRILNFFEASCPVAEQAPVAAAA